MLDETFSHQYSKTLHRVHDFARRVRDHLLARFGRGGVHVRRSTSKLKARLVVQVFTDQRLAPSMRSVVEQLCTASSPFRGGGSRRVATDLPRLGGEASQIEPLWRFGTTNTTTKPFGLCTKTVSRWLQAMLQNGTASSMRSTSSPSGARGNLWHSRSVVLPQTSATHAQNW